MTATFSRLGNDLHAARRTVPIVSRRRRWYLISVVVLVLLGSIAVLRGPNLGIEFTGGSELQVAGVSDTDELVARDVVRDQLPDNEPKVTVLGQDTMRVQTEQLDSTQTAQLASDLAQAYGVEDSAVSTSYIGPVWSQDITQKMARGVVVFLLLVTVTMALYFRNLKASAAAMLALVHDMVLTAAVYGVVGFEITPGTVIGFLTVMGYSLYDTIVVFDKVRENVADLPRQTRSTFAELVELGANQSLVRSINTSVVALLPVGSILGIGAFLLGAGTLKDISLALFVGILAGTYSSIFLAPGLLVDLRRREPAIAAHTRTIQQSRRPGDGAGDGEDDAGPAADEQAAGESAADGDEATDPEELVGAEQSATRGGDPADSHEREEATDSPDSADSADRPERRQPRRSTRRERGSSRRGRR